MFVRYKNNKQTKSIFDKIFYKIVYHHIIYMCNFFVVICTGFHEIIVYTRCVP